MTANVPDSDLSRRGLFARLAGSVAPGDDDSPPHHEAASREWLVLVQQSAHAANGQEGAVGQSVQSPALAGEARSDSPQPLGGWSKRALDLIVAACALVLAAPLMLAVALLIKAATGGPVFFAHRRVGFNGKPFDCYKFRTMMRDADKLLEAHLARDPQAEREWREKRKLTRDPRTTFLGQMLRKSSIDELPQLFNVLRGDMSCVGPRPIVADELQRYGTLSEEYLRARPGLTGLWQISGRSSVEYDRRISLDVEYIRNWSLLTDITILAWTAIAVMKFENAS